MEMNSSPRNDFTQGSNEEASGRVGAAGTVPRGSGLTGYGGVGGLHQGNPEDQSI